jgi:hypothetical protein
MTMKSLTWSRGIVWPSSQGDTGRSSSLGVWSCALLSIVASLSSWSTVMVEPGRLLVSWSRAVAKELGASLGVSFSGGCREEDKQESIPLLDRHSLPPGFEH